MRDRAADHRSFLRARRARAATTTVSTMLAVVALCAVTLAPLPVVAVVECTGDRSTWDAKKLAECGLQATAGEAKLGAPQSLPDLIGMYIYAALSLVGVVFLILMIYGGFRWMTAQGESDVVQKAKDVIKAALIGIVVIGLAFAITNFVIKVIASGAGGG